jgi:hypothetical protein
VFPAFDAFKGQDPAPPDEAAGFDTRVVRFLPPMGERAVEWKLVGTRPDGTSHAVRLCYDPDQGWLLTDLRRTSRDAEVQSALREVGVLVSSEASS